MLEDGRRDKWGGDGRGEKRGVMKGERIQEGGEERGRGKGMREGRIVEGRGKGAETKGKRRE